MWPRGLRELCQIDHPIVLAPLAGGPGTPELAAAVSEAGALGSIGGGYLAPQALRDDIRRLRALTSRPFLVNLFVPGAAPPRTPSAEETARAAAFVAPFRAEVGLAGTPPLPPPPAFRDQLAVVLEEAVPIFSFTSGALGAEDALALQRRGAVVIGTATTPDEAKALVAAGAQAVVAQGSEAAGHRGTFATPPEHALVGLMALVPRIADAVDVPVLAAGGIMDGRGIAAALALGAAGVQLGTAFLACAESGASAPYKEAVLAARGGGDPTVLTNAFSGRLARALANRFTDAASGAPLLPYPQQNALTGELRQAAARAGRPDLLSLWAGQAVGLARSRPARELVLDLVAETRAAIERLGKDSP
jgi:nitronate monooxygenase